MGTVPPHVAEISRGFGETAGKPLSRSKAKGFAKIFVDDVFNLFADEILINDIFADEIFVDEIFSAHPLILS